MTSTTEILRNARLYVASEAREMARHYLQRIRDDRAKGNRAVTIRTIKYYPLSEYIHTARFKDAYATYRKYWGMK